MLQAAVQNGLRSGSGQVEPVSGANRLGQVETEARWALQRSLWDKPWLRGVAQSLLSAFQALVGTV